VCDEHKTSQNITASTL